MTGRWEGPKRVRFKLISFGSRDTVYAATWGVSHAVFKAYRERADAEAAYNRALNRGAIRQYERRDEAAIGMSIQPVTSNHSLTLSSFSTPPPWP